ncbi:MAG TPA: 50S ribosomal protein L25 [Saprospiraceae bacterium]|nr:50S ribosomal protein L25 [Saprospiraceae bacterium]HMQ85314.1 50S ribosomal protein L25 [Saprospiraceae bacterium]
MEVVAISPKKRADLGKKASKAVRREEEIPCVMYGGEENIFFSVTSKDVKDLIYTPDFKLAEINIDGKNYRAFIKDIQWHPITDSIRHIDFLLLAEGRKVKVDVPLRFTGVSPGVKLGGKLLQNVRKITIKTLPKHLIDAVYVDISNLDLGQSVRVRDIKPEDNVEIMNAPSIPIATIEIPRALRSAAAAADKKK